MTSPVPQQPWIDAKHVPLFVTASRPFPAEWIEAQCQAAERASIANDSLDDKIQLTHISGDFVGWTPYKLARDYVYPELFEKRTTYTFVSFVVLDDRSHEDGKFVIVGVHPDSFKGKPLELEATARMDVECAVEMPIIFHDGHQGILAYGEAEPYDNDAEQNSAQG